MKEEYKNDEFLAALDAAGADVDGALNRFMGKVFLYEKFMKKFLDDRSYPDMLDCLAGHDLEEAFRQAHTLKGVEANDETRCCECGTARFLLNAMGRRSGLKGNCLSGRERRRYPHLRTGTCIYC